MDGPFVKIYQTMLLAFTYRSGIYTKNNNKNKAVILSLICWCRSLKLNGCDLIFCCCLRKGVESEVNLLLNNVKELDEILLQSITIWGD